MKSDRSTGASREALRPSGGPGRILWAALIVALGVALLCLPLLLHEQLPQGSDVYSTTHYLQGFMKAFAEGDFYPRWTDRSNQQLGGPSFVMFVPLTYYGAGLTAWLTGSVISGFKLYILVVSALTGAAFFLLARNWLGAAIPAALAAAIYLLLPYHVLDIYQRFAMSETTAFITTALTFFLLRRDADRPGILPFMGAAIAYAALVGTHLITGFMTTFVLAFWIPWDRRFAWRQMVRPFLALGCGLALSAPALLPALVEKGSANISWVKEMPNGDYRRNFIYSDDVLPGLGFKDPVKPPVRRSAHAQLLLAGVAAVAAIGGSAPGTRRRRDAVGLSIISAMMYVMQTPLSTPIWMAVPELSTIQFPWRFQAIQVLCAALLCGMALSAPERLVGRRVLHGALAGAFLLNLGVAWSNAHLKPYDFGADDARHPGVEFWMEPAFTPIEFASYRRFKQMRIAVPMAEFQSGEGTVEVVEWLSSRRRLTVNSDAGGTVVLRSFWFPGWAARLDGESVPIRPSADLALHTVEVPGGPHTLELAFESTFIRRASSWIGLAALLATPGLAVVLQRTSAPPPARP